MGEMIGQTCQSGQGISGMQSLAGVNLDPAMAPLLEPVAGLVSMSRICAYHARRDNPDLEELREVIALMIASSEAVLGMIQPGNEHRKG